MSNALYQSAWSAPQRKSREDAIIELYNAGKISEAFEICCSLVNQGKASHTFKQYLVEMMHSLTFNHFDLGCKQAITICLREDNLGHQLMTPCWFTLFNLDPSFETFRDLYKAENTPSIVETLDLEPLIPCLKDDFLLLAMKRGTIPNLNFEKALTILRRYFLERILQDTLSETQINEITAFLVALSEYSWDTEFIFQESKAEQKQLETLQKKLEETTSFKNTLALAQLSIFACYQPLRTLSNADTLSGEDIPAFAKMITAQISDYEEEQRLKKKIRILGKIENKTSREVRSQYEENPYPRWKIGIKNDTNANLSNIDILSAGCGTGQEISVLAASYRNACIIGTDLSLSSLAYADRELKANGLKNRYELIQADILNLEQLNRKFDFISCNGVLHHMKDPMAGWKVLRKILKPHGKMKISLYSKTAREAIITARKIIQEKGYPPTREGIKKFRTEAFSIPGIPEDICNKWIDYYRISECRDMLFHVQEHDFTIPKIQQCLGKLNLTFGGFKLSSAAMAEYRSMFPDDPECLKLENWDKMEQKYNYLFSKMYQFIVHANVH